MDNTSAALPDGTWNLDPSATTVTVSTKMMSLITVPATLAISSGSISITDGQIANVEVTADAGSYTSAQKKRNDHISSADFLDAAQHPTITFSASGGTTSQVSGQVTVKGKSTPLTFNVSSHNVEGDRATFSATTTADRMDLGITKMPGFIIGTQLDITVAAEATTQ